MPHDLEKLGIERAGSGFPMMKTLMKLIDRTKQDIRTVLTEFIALWFILADRRIRWRVKIVLFIPIIYISMPVNLIPDIFIFFGQLDDLIVVRISYSALNRLIAADILTECREKARAFTNERQGKRFKVAFTLSAIWITVATFFVLHLMRKSRSNF